MMMNSGRLLRRAPFGGVLAGVVILVYSDVATWAQAPSTEPLLEWRSNGLPIDVEPVPYRQDRPGWSLASGDQNPDSIPFDVAMWMFLEQIAAADRSGSDVRMRLTNEVGLSASDANTVLWYVRDAVHALEIQRREASVQQCRARSPDVTMADLRDVLQQHSDDQDALRTALIAGLEDVLNDQAWQRMANEAERKRQFISVAWMVDIEAALEGMHGDSSAVEILDSMCRDS